MCFLSHDNNKLILAVALWSTVRGHNLVTNMPPHDREMWVCMDLIFYQTLSQPDYKLDLKFSTLSNLCKM